MNRSTLALSVACVAVLLAATPSNAGIIVGTNPSLNPLTGKLFIPLMPSTGGNLGDFLGGRKKVGLQGDKIKLVGMGANTSGSVMFELAFQILEPIKPETAKLVLNFRDLDFAAQVLAGGSFREWLDLAFVADAENPVGPVNLTLDSTNFFDFRTDTVDPVNILKTNNAKARYEIPLAALGLSQAELNNIATDREFGLYVTLHSELTRTKKGTGRFTNSAENFQNSFVFEGGEEPPEPATVALLAAGLPLVLRRRRRA